jgi:hypothetical protein
MVWYLMYTSTIQYNISIFYWYYSTGIIYISMRNLCDAESKETYMPILYHCNISAIQVYG